jgi:hypothetical protein
VAIDVVATRVIGPIACGERICEEGAVRGGGFTVNLDAVGAQVVKPANG